jgi:hypothetical protein
VRIERLPAFGSDHFPICVELALAESAARPSAAPVADADDQEQADEKVAAEGVNSDDVHTPKQTSKTTPKTTPKG